MRSLTRSGRVLVLSSDRDRLAGGRKLVEHLPGVEVTAGVAGGLVHLRDCLLASGANPNRVPLTEVNFLAFDLEEVRRLFATDPARLVALALRHLVAPPLRRPPGHCHPIHPRWPWWYRW